MAHPTGPVAEAFATRVAIVESESAVTAGGALLCDRAAALQAEDEICSLRTPFQRDRDRIVHCKAFRRLKRKTQVFIAPEGDHFRTRLTHTLEVSGISRNVARALRLNEDLTEAIALGHDLGHAPFGHTGEEALDRVLCRSATARLPPQRAVAADRRRAGARRPGLNLTDEVRDGILHHTGRGRAGHARGRDRPPGRPLRLRQPRHRRRRPGRDPRPDDAARRPDRAARRTSSRRIDALVHDLVETSDAAGAIGQTDASAAALLELRAFMFDQVYLRPDAREQARAGERSSRTCCAISSTTPSELSRGPRVTT